MNVTDHPENSPDVTCLGGANVDYKLQLLQPHQPGTSNPVSTSRTFGGVIRNVATNLAQLKVKVSLMSLLGDDAAGDEMVADCLPKMKLHASEQVSGCVTGTYSAVLDQSGDLVAGYVDMAISQLMNKDWIERHRDHLRQAEWVVADCNITSDAMESLLELIKQDSRKLAIVTISEPKMKHLPQDLTGVTLLITNLAESKAYFQVTQTDARQLAERWLETGLDNIIITDGTQPVTFGSKGHILQQPVVKVPKQLVVDVTGAGDSFSAGAIYGLMNNHSLEQSVAIATRLAALTVQVAESVRSDVSIQEILEAVI